jgi:hypothetical protein
MQGLLTLIIVCVVLSERNSIYRLICFSSPSEEGQGTQIKTDLANNPLCFVQFKGMSPRFRPSTNQSEVRVHEEQDSLLFLHSTSGQHLISSPNTPHRNCGRIESKRTDTQTDILQGGPYSAICVQRFDDSLNPAIHITYRSLLRSSSMHEPRDPPLKVVMSICYIYTFV